MKHLVKSPGDERRTDIFSESVRMTPDLQNHQVQPNRGPYVYEKNFNPQYCVRFSTWNLPKMFSTEKIL